MSKNIKDIEKVKEQYEKELMNIDGVVGVGVGSGPKLIVFVQEGTPEILRAIPNYVNGYEVEVKVVGKIVAEERKTTHKFVVPPGTIKKKRIQAVKVPEDAIAIQKDKLSVDTKKLNKGWHWYEEEDGVFFLEKTEEKVVFYESMETKDGEYIAFETCEMDV